MTEENVTPLNHYRAILAEKCNIDLSEIDPEKVEKNPAFSSLGSWLKIYLGPATAQLNGIDSPSLKAIRDENRNAIIPQRVYVMDGQDYYLSIKGCGAYEDMFFGGELTPNSIRNACQDPTVIPSIDRMQTGLGFLMSESWMGESPYGGQGDENAYDELHISMKTSNNRVSINGAYICPVIGIVQYPADIERLARKFFWCRTYPGHFFQVVRLVPSTARLYYESKSVVADPSALFDQFDIKSNAAITSFEINFIKSGIGLCSLFTRSARVNRKKVTGLVYQDVWFDKDAVVATDGYLHFADLEGLVWKTIPRDQYIKTQVAEWQKLVFEFVFALVKIDSFRRQVDHLSTEWNTQREDLSEMISIALDGDGFAFPQVNDKGCFIIIERSDLPSVKIPFLERYK